VVISVATALVWDRVVEGVIFQPTAGLSGSAPQGSGAQDVFLTSADGVRVHAYWFPASSRSVDAPASPRAILFLHGNAGNAFHRLPNAEKLARLGAGVLLLDYRGYGRSEGRPTEAGVLLDARAALEHLTEVRGVPENRIVVFGRSLGGAVAVDLAQGRPLAGVILESTFTSVADVAQTLGGPLLAALVAGRFESEARVAGLRAPALFFHGDRDRVIPYALGRQLFEAVPGPKWFETLVGAGHNDTLRVGGKAYLQRIGAFLDAVAPLVESDGRGHVTLLEGREVFPCG
jgi:hypothetical protein